MNRKIFIIIGIFVILTSLSVFAQDNNKYGEYLLSSMQKKISLDLDAAPLVGVLKLLSEQTGLNFVSSEAVDERKLTLYVNDVPLKEALSMIFKANNLVYDYDPLSNIFIVKDMGKPDKELITKTYFFKYTRVAVSRLQKEADTIDEARRSGLAEAEGADDSSSNDEEETKTEDDGGILQVIKANLNDAQKEKAIEDAITNSITVIATPKKMTIIDQIVKSLDIPNEQVVIEVEMLDVMKDDADKLGFYMANGLYAKYSGPADAIHFPIHQNRVLVGTLSLADFSVIMQFLATRTDTKFLARPKILTVANETAEVNLTVNEAIGVKRTATGNSNVVTEEVERQPTGTKLRVTPQINTDTSEITLYVEVWNRESTNSTIRLTSMSQGYAQNPEERGSRAIVRVLDGETVFIGGMIRNQEKTIITKVPLLGDIPLIGKLFSFKDKSIKERELLVFLTPRLFSNKGKTKDVKNQGKVELREQSDPARRDTIVNDLKELLL